MKTIILCISALFIFIQGKSQLLNDFETWHNYSGGFTPLTVPNNWSGTDSLVCFYGLFTNPGGTFVAQVEQEAPGNGGGKALKVVTKNQDSLTGFLAAGPMPCMSSNAKIDVDQITGAFSFTGGTPFGYTPYTASVWVKTDLVGSDSTQFTILAIDDSDGGDSIVAVADTTFGSNISTFTQITIPFQVVNGSFSTTKLQVIVSSSANFIIDPTPAFANLNAGTSLTVDDIMISAPNGTSQYLLSSKTALVFAEGGKLHVNLQSGDHQVYQLQVCALNGQVLHRLETSGILNQFQLPALSNGTYLYQLLQGNKVVQSGKFLY